jgi:hypothetical protein
MKIDKKKIGIGLLVIAVLGGGVGLWTRSSNKFPSPPRLETASPKQVSEFIASDQFGKLPDLAQQEYLNTMLHTYNTPAEAKRILMEVSRFSSDKIRTFRDNGIRGFLRVNLIREAMVYRNLKDQGKRDRFLDQSFQQLETLEPWLIAINSNPLLKKELAVDNYADIFKPVIEHATPLERAATETYLLDSLRRYFRRSAREALDHR